MLPVTSTTIRLFLHGVAATVWVGGQLTLAGLVPGLRQLHADAPRAVARRFSRLAWLAFGVLVATGVWNVVEVEFGDASDEYQVTLLVKLGIVAVSGVAAAHHQRATTRRGLAVGGAVSGVAALAALLLGVLLRS